MMLGSRILFVAKFNCLRKYTTRLIIQIFTAAGRNPQVYGPIYKAFFSMVHGGSEQTLRVLVAYYRQKTEFLVYSTYFSETVNKVILPTVTSLNIVDYATQTNLE